MEDNERELSFTEQIHFLDCKEVKRTYRLYIEDKKNKRVKILDIDGDDMEIIERKKE